MAYQSICLTFQDLEELTFKEAAIHAFDYTLEDGQITEFKLTLFKDALLENDNVTSAAFLSNHINWEGLEEYLLANNPSVEKIGFLETQDEEKSYPVKWLLLPNPSLQDCQCEPINANAYSKLENNYLIIGADEKNGAKTDHYMAKEI